ncbi:MAG: MBL fold metallo-hydrolase, partial [Candidatus Latescibacteria bacterium]|nr:MBL fold metallo-hydrolase [Candidatus Latescibacterota bacterium]
MYILKKGEDAIAIDFGSGQWLAHLSEIGVKNLNHVLLTHAHRDQCYGLASQTEWPFEVHASGEDTRFFQTDRLKAFWRTYQAGGCPPNYTAPREPLPFVKGDMGDASELFWKDTTIGVVPTPGHTRGAMTYVVNWGNKITAFCGDAVHEGGKLHQPYHLEWDHWTGEGALAAWYGLERLSGCRVDVLCPSHGEVMKQGANASIR